MIGSALTNGHPAFLQMYFQENSNTIYNVSEDLPRWRMETSAAQLGFTLTRKQFPIMPAFCTTINKIQGHTMNKIGIYLDRAIFAHGQLYVALSRAIGPHAVLLMIQETQTQGKNSNNDNYHTLNIVHRELFQY